MSQPRYSGGGMCLPPMDGFLTIVVLFLVAAGSMIGALYAAAVQALHRVDHKPAGISRVHCMLIGGLVMLVALLVLMAFVRLSLAWSQHRQERSATPD